MSWRDRKNIGFREECENYIKKTLNFLHRRKRTHISSISSALGISPTIASGIVRALVGLGFLEADVSSQAVLVSLTKYGLGWVVLNGNGGPESKIEELEDEIHKLKTGDD